MDVELVYERAKEIVAELPIVSYPRFEVQLIDCEEEIFPANEKGLGDLHNCLVEHWECDDYYEKDDTIKVLYCESESDCTTLYEYQKAGKYDYIKSEYLKNGRTPMTVKFIPMKNLGDSTYMVCEEVKGVLFQWLWTEKDYYGLEIPDKISPIKYREEFEDLYISTKTSEDFMDFFYEKYNNGIPWSRMFPPRTAFLSWFHYNIDIINIDEVVCPNLFYKNDSIKLADGNRIIWRKKEYSYIDFWNMIEEN